MVGNAEFVMTDNTRFRVTDTSLAGLKLVERTVRGDDRGFLSRFYCREELAVMGFDRPIVQINHTLTCHAGAIRGLHFQHPPHAEDKFVSVLRGEIFDVALDLRAGSPTLGRWHSEPLSAENRRSLFIPRGFAHGFQALTDDCELIYLHSQAYVPAAEGGIDAFDQTIAIDWPLPVTDMSERDRQHPRLTRDFAGLTI